MIINESIVRNAEAGGFVIYAQPNANEAIRVPVTTLAPLLVSALAPLIVPSLISGDAENGIILGGDSLLYGTNIYNTDGILSGDRIVDGNNNDLSFIDLALFTVNISGTDKLVIDSTSITLNQDAGANDSNLVINTTSIEATIFDGTTTANYRLDALLSEYSHKTATKASYILLDTSEAKLVSEDLGVGVNDARVVCNSITPSIIASVTDGTNLSTLSIDIDLTIDVTDGVDASNLDVTPNQFTFDINTVEKFFIDLSSSRITQGTVGTAYGRLEVQPTAVVTTAATTTNQNVDTQSPNQTIRSIINSSTSNESKYTQNITGVGLIPRHLIEAFDGSLRSYIEILKNGITILSDNGDVFIESPSNSRIRAIVGADVSTLLLTPLTGTFSLTDGTFLRTITLDNTGINIGASNGVNSAQIIFTDSKIDLTFGGNADLQLNTSAGNSGQVLTSQGSGASPIWRDAGGVNVVSASNPVVLGDSGHYTYNGNVPTASDLPDIATNIGKEYIVINSGVNAGVDTWTFNRIGTDEILIGTSVVTTFDTFPGEIYKFYNNSLYWVLKS